jgi:type II restriction enzyme
MSYFEQIRELTKSIPSTIVDFSVPRSRARTPTQASTNFTTNKEQGDWAETLIIRAINEHSNNHVAVKYGKSDDIIAGENGFDEFFQEFQDELDTIGKRPDILIFKKQDFNPKLSFDISHIPHIQITDYVKQAIAGIEIRSSAFLIDKYEEEMQKRTQDSITTALNINEKLLSNYQDIFSDPKTKRYLDTLTGITENSLQVISFTSPSWSSNERWVQAKMLFRKLKEAIKVIKKRENLSITPKVEDIKVVYKWIETFNVKHYYFQVFFDKVYGISFQDILQIISDPVNEDTKFWIETDTKNQNKTTIKIISKSGVQLAAKVDEPAHQSVRKELSKGRLLFYVTFNGGNAYLDISNLALILGIDAGDF